MSASLSDPDLRKTDAVRERGKSPSFEERYGPWICMGCGLAHKLGKPCPINSRGSRIREPFTESGNGGSKEKS